MNSFHFFQRLFNSANYRSRTVDATITQFYQHIQKYTDIETAIDETTLDELLPYLENLTHPQVMELAKDLSKWSNQQQNILLQLIKKAKNSIRLIHYLTVREGVFTQYWNTQTSNKAVFAIYQLIFKHTLAGQSSHEINYYKDFEIKDALAVIHSMDKNTMCLLAEDAIHWTKSEREILLYFVSQKKIDFELKYPLITKELFYESWTTKAIHPKVINIYQCIFKHTTLLFQFDRDFDINLVLTNLKTLTEEELAELKEDLKNWLSKQLQLLQYIVDTDRFDDYLSLYIFKTRYANSWKSTSNHPAIIQFYRKLLDGLSQSSDYWEIVGFWEYNELLKYFIENEWEELKQDLPNWTDDQLETFAEGIFNEENYSKELDEFDVILQKRRSSLLPILIEIGAQRKSQHMPEFMLCAFEYLDLILLSDPQPLFLLSKIKNQINQHSFVATFKAVLHETIDKAIEQSKAHFS